MRQTLHPKTETCEQALAHLHRAFDFPYALVGGGAARLYGSSRPWSNDIDILLDPRYVPRAGGQLEWKLYAMEQDRLTWIYQGINIDLLEAKTPLEKKTVGQATTLQVPGGQVKIAIPDHLILLKASILREKDRADILAILRTAGMTDEGIREAKKMGLWGKIGPIIEKAKSKE